jgi:hypothetical protein
MRVVLTDPSVTGRPSEFARTTRSFNKRATLTPHWHKTTRVFSIEGDCPGHSHLRTDLNKS